MGTDAADSQSQVLREFHLSFTDPSGRRTELSEELRVTVREPGRQHWAICCSGGGIRSAAYCLGAMQELQERIMDRVRLVTAVSGGSYLAAGRAAIQRELTAAGVERPPFAQGSDEERHLRQHTRYLVPGWPQGLVGLGGCSSAPR